MREVSFLGISLSYLFCGAVTLISARRFGAIGGAAVGFVSAFAVSGTYSAAFMLAGFVSGAMGGFGILYSVVFGGVALSVFAAYVGGVTGLTGALPEYAAAGALCVPLLKKIKPYTTKNDAPSTDRAAIDMVGTMALAYKNTGRKTLRALNPLLCNLSAALGAFLTRMPSYEELSSLVFGVINKHLPYVEKDENLEKIATKLYKKEGISRQDLAYLGVSDGEIFSIFTDIKDMYDTLLLSCAPPSD